MRKLSGWLLVTGLTLLLSLLLAGHLTVGAQQRYVRSSCDDTW
ncbi:MAG: hypothetical protein RR135_02430 [Oscillospiraceae bacterium]